jgi:hypothetical protein
VDRDRKAREADVTERQKRGVVSFTRTLALLAALAALVFAGSLLLRHRVLPSGYDTVADATSPVTDAIKDAPPADKPAAAAEGVAESASQAKPIDWTMVASGLTFFFTAFGAISGAVLGWRKDRRHQRESDLRIRELELEISKLQQVG